MIEVELKFEVPTASRALFQAELENLPKVRWFGQIYNSDSYYDTANFDCLQQAVFIRVRNHEQLEMKFHDRADPGHTHSTERSFLLESPRMKEINLLCSRFISRWQAANSIEEAFRINGLMEYVHIANKRTQYEHGNLMLSVDDVEGLGNFFEIETACEEGTEIEQALTRLRGFVSDFAFPALRPVKTGYVEQWLRLHNPQVYQLRKVPA
ncbi:MAG TPA: CYTH domain-containing protein [Ktedonobacteraceae bacterium]|nr:CYTH domain-containing protein [Ktedonobacteraceae bacterium]